jgi:ribosomal-protein-serine acetyltransferase
MRHDAPAPAEVIDAGPVVLRRWRPDDLDASCAAVFASLEHLRPWMPWALDFSRAAQAEFLVGSERDWNARVGFNYAILTGGAIAGSAGLMARIGPGGLEIGYWVHPDFTGRGVATSAAAALTDAALALPAVDHVEIHHDVLNLASERVPAKLGFAVIGTTTGRFALAPADSGTTRMWRITR